MQNTKEYLSKVTGNDYIDIELFNKFNVKRGLRNADGTGVLVGLTRVGDVHGYIMDEGEKTPVDGKLFYRGINVEDLVAAAAAEGRFGFEEVVYLLMFGVLPNKEQLDNFSSLIGEKRSLPPNFAEDSIMKAPSRDIMNKLARSVLTLYSWDDDPENQSPENVLRQCLELIARFPTIVAYSYMAKKHYYDNESLIIHLPPPSCSTAETLLSLIRPDQQFTKLEAEILDLALILHAEHGGGNNSTFAVHLVSSADTDTYAALTTGINSLKGAKHGGANIQVVGMVEDIKKHVKRWDNVGEVADYLLDILRGEAYDHSGLIYGQGHPVYTKSDPRAVLLRSKAATLAVEKNRVEEFELYRLIERLTPEVFKKFNGSGKDMCTNVDFYSGFVYGMLGIPTELYTPIFAISRVAGWAAHRMEEIVAGGRIIRPAYKCVQKRLDYTPLASREE
ncbi:citrate synthase domain protein [Treponema primitia ZAS-2]|uniref:citrate synthase (unknown stereospecificity) n=1 Tax=Treponema primitia (strain ATCC BAA-887 / DSM 12427 / ZAS-2) TaxID=545694 RepID=F5YH53_TREPZ|nr:citrate/2-methylcitrate synthase [Treponema primitia]AEF85677.1 citrate synthase domain protein [Treponema primitia ZAS-2]